MIPTGYNLINVSVQSKEELKREDKSLLQTTIYIIVLIITTSFIFHSRLLNISTAKFISVTLVIVLACYHSILHVTYGVTPCKGLFKVILSSDWLIEQYWALIVVVRMECTRVISGSPGDAWCTSTPGLTPRDASDTTDSGAVRTTSSSLVRILNLLTKKLLFLDNFLKTIVFLTYFNIFILQPFSFRVGLTNLK